MLESDASVYVKTRIAERFQFKLTGPQLGDWIRAVIICKDQEEAEKYVTQLVDYGRLNIPAFRALYAAAHPYNPPATPGPTSENRKAAMEARKLIFQTGDAMGIKTLRAVDHVRAHKPAAWKPLSDDETERRKTRLLSQFQALSRLPKPGPIKDEGITAVAGQAQPDDDLTEFPHAPNRA